MAAGRYVVLGLASARSAWFRDVAQWANASAVAVEFVKCVSAEEVRARLASGRPFSALLADSSLPVVDRDLVEVAQQAGCAVIVVDDGRGGRDWIGLGANAALATGFDRKALVDTLAAHTVMIGRSDRVRPPDADGAEAWRAPLVAVCGPGGTGTSTVAIALAQGLAKDVRTRGSIVLADLALRGDQAMLHDARDVVPGVQELVEAFRSGQPRIDEIRASTFSVEARGYQLLLGLRRPRAWATIRPRAFAAALDGLRKAYRIVVADTDADLEGEDEGGSIDVEERHTMTRTAIATADVVVVVGVPGLKGVHSLVSVMADILTFGVASPRVLPVVNRAPRSSRARAAVTASLQELLPSWAGEGMPALFFWPERHIDQALHDGVALPDALVEPLARRVSEVMRYADPEARRPDGPQLVTPGSMATWSEL